MLDRIRLVGLSAHEIDDEAALAWVAQTIEELRPHMEEIREL